MFLPHPSTAGRRVGESEQGEIGSVDVNGAAGLEEDGYDDQADAEPEGGADLAGLAEDDGGEDDAIDGLEVVKNVDREGGEVSQGVDL